MYQAAAGAYSHVNIITNFALGLHEADAVYLVLVVVLVPVFKVPTVVLIPRLMLLMAVLVIRPVLVPLVHRLVTIIRLVVVLGPLLSWRPSSPPYCEERVDAGWPAAVTLQTAMAAKAIHRAIQLARLSMLAV